MQNVSSARVLFFCVVISGVMLACLLRGSGGGRDVTAFFRNNVGQSWLPELKRCVTAERREQKISIHVVFYKFTFDLFE